MKDVKAQTKRRRGPHLKVASEQKEGSKKKAKQEKAALNFDTQGRIAQLFSGICRIKEQTEEGIAAASRLQLAQYASKLKRKRAKTDAPGGQGAVASS